MSFKELAEERFLSSATPHLGELQWDVAPAADLQGPIPTTVTDILALLQRRGLQPALVSRLLDLFPSRPLERALLAWDILERSLLGRNDTELVARLTAAIGPLKQLGANASGVAFPRERIPTLIEAARPATHDGVLDDYLETPSLAALVVMRDALSSLDDRPSLIAVTLDHVKRLASAHLPSLALAFLQILWDRFTVQLALDLMLEVALDFGHIEAVPQVAPTDDVSTHRKAYGLLRAYCAHRDMAAAAELAGAVSRLPATRDSLDPSLLLAQAELAFLEDKPPDPATISLVNLIAPSTSNWRYAVQVRDSLSFQTRPETAAAVLAELISRFGNDVEMWSRAAQNPNARADLMKLLSHEVRYLSHEPHVWRTVALFSADTDSIYAEIDQRLSTQLSSALA